MFGPMQPVLRIFVLAFIVSAITTFIFFSDYFGSLIKEPPVVINVIEEVPQNSANQAPILLSPDNNDDNTKKTAPTELPGPNEMALVEGVYVRTSSSDNKNCSYGSYRSLGLRKTPDGSSYVIIGNDDPTFEVTYPLRYDAVANTCSFFLDAGETKYYSSCEISMDPNVNKPKIKITNITTLKSSYATSGNETSCFDGEEFTLKE